MGNSTSEFALMRCFPTSFQVGIHVLWEPGHFCCLHQLLNCGASISGYTGDQKKLQKVLEFWDGERKFHRISLLYHIIKSSSEYLQRLALLHLKLRMDSMPEFWSRSYSQRRSPLPMDHPWSMCHGAKSFVWGRWVDVDQDDGFEFRKTLQTSWVKYSMTGIFMMWLPPKVFFCPIKRQFGWMNDPKLRYLVWLNVMIHPEWRF